MNRLPLTLLASAALLSSTLSAAISAGDSPTDPPASMGPSAGAHESSQTTPSLKAPGKAAFATLDKDDDGQISEAEAAADPVLKDSFGLSDENKDDKHDAGEFARSKASGSPAASTPAAKP